jgi:hypothetical protein
MKMSIVVVLLAFFVQLAAIPVGAGEKVYGWIAAFCEAEGGEFDRASGGACTGLLEVLCEDMLPGTMECLEYDKRFTVPHPQPTAKGA